MKITIIIGLGVVLLLLAIVKSSYSIKVNRYEGALISIREGGINDAVFQLDNESSSFYINRGYEKYTENQLYSLIGKKVTIWANHTNSILDPFGKSSKNIIRLKVDNSDFFVNNQ